MRPTTRRRSGSRSSRENSTRAGTRSGKRRLRGRSRWESFRPNAKLTPRPDEIPAWDSLNADQKKVFAHMMEVYAAALTYADHQMGRILDAIDDLGQLDNTLVIYIQGDNGASAEGGFNGLLNEMTFFNGIPEDFNEVLRAHGRTRFGDDVQPLPHRLGACDEHAASMDEAGRFPLRRHAQRPGHLVAGADQGQGRHPHSIPPRDRYRADDSGGGGSANAVRAQRRAAEARSKASAWSTPSTTPKAPSRRRTQYFEMAANRAIYDDGWVACTTPPVAPWVSVWQAHRHR